jgi:SAM-dependent methyltransferase
VVEVGSSYGAFTYLLDRLGYRATGVELSPSMVEQSTAQFGIPVRQGPVSQAGLVAPLSCIFSFDCLEHVPNPVAELQLYHHLLAPDGLLVVQTPNANLASPKWCSIQFRPQEHLFLFTPDAISQLLHRSGFAHIQFLPSLYWHDMFLIASPHLIQADADRIARILTHHPLVAAMLDMYRRLMNLEPYDCELDQLVSKFYELHQFTANRYKTNNQP